MAVIDAVRSDVEAASSAPVEGSDRSAVVCNKASEALRGEMNRLLASVNRTDGSKIVAREEINGEFPLTTSNGRGIWTGEIARISSALSGMGFEIKTGGKEGCERVYVARRRDVSPDGSGGVNGDRVSKVERRRAERAARQKRRKQATCPRLHPVES